MGWEMTPEVIWSSVLIGVLPFNAIKGIIVGILFVPLFIKMKNWVEQQQAKFI